MGDEQGAGAVTRWGKVPAWWLLHDGVDADRFCVLAALATYADGNGLCDPSQATLARHLKRSRPWVNRVVAQLAEEGFIEKTVRSRRNGGATSCLYRLRLEPLGAAVTSVTPAVAEEDSPRHGPDRSQPELQQSQDTRFARIPERLITLRTRKMAIDAVPPDWTPRNGEVTRALEQCPGADLDAHTARFVSRCRSRGYRYAPDVIGEAWLTWLLEDRRRDASRPEPGSSLHAPRPRFASPVARADERLAAWATSASSCQLRS